MMLLRKFAWYVSAVLSIHAEKKMSSWTNYFSSQNFLQTFIIVGTIILVVHVTTQFVVVAILMLIPTNKSL